MAQKPRGFEMPLADTFAVLITLRPFSSEPVALPLAVPGPSHLVVVSLAALVGVALPLVMLLEGVPVATASPRAVGPRTAGRAGLRGDLRPAITTATGRGLEGFTRSHSFFPSRFFAMGLRYVGEEFGFS
jgi:hypothetical protein